MLRTPLVDAYRLNKYENSKSAPLMTQAFVSNEKYLVNLKDMKKKYDI